MAGSAVLKGVRKLVSKDRIRFQEDDYDLDLSYITDSLIAMSFPSTGLTSVWRNHIDDVHRLLYTRHEGRFMIWNLSEEKYNYEKFNNQILDFPFPDHHAPPLTLLFAIVHSIDSWLQASPRNVAVVHCKGGKGRTGVVIVCCLMFGGQFPDIQQAAQHFARQRSATAKGVTQPSQVRYLSYFSDTLRGSGPLFVRPLMLVDARLGPIPRSWELVLEIFTYKDNNEPELQFRSPLHHTSAGESPFTMLVADLSSGECVSMLVPIGVEVANDVLVKAFRVGKKGDAKEVFHVIFHTYFVVSAEKASAVVRFEKHQLDAGSKKIPKDFALTIAVRRIQSQKEAAGGQPDIFAGSALINSMRKQFRERTRGRPAMTSMGRHRNPLQPADVPAPSASAPLQQQQHAFGSSAPDLGSAPASSGPSPRLGSDASSAAIALLSAEERRSRRYSSGLTSPASADRAKEHHRRESTTAEALVDPLAGVSLGGAPDSAAPSAADSCGRERGSTVAESTFFSSSPSGTRRSRHLVPAKPPPATPLSSSSSPCFVRSPHGHGDPVRRTCILSAQRGAQLLSSLAGSSSASSTPSSSPISLSPSVSADLIDLSSPRREQAHPPLATSDSAPALLGLAQPTAAFPQQQPQQLPLGGSAPVLHEAAGQAIEALPLSAGQIATQQQQQQSAAATDDVGALLGISNGDQQLPPGGTASSLLLGLDDDDGKKTTSAEDPV